MKSNILLFFILVLFKTAVSQQTNAFKIYPQDESKTDTSLTSFLIKLKNIAEHKDTTNLYKILDDDILISYSVMQNGKQEFITLWNLNNPDSSALWKVIINMIQLGGVFDTIDAKRVFCLPYANASKLFSHLVVKNKDLFFDPYGTLICINKKASVFEIPSQKSKITGHLSYDIVSYDFQLSMEQNRKNQQNPSWAYVSTLDGKTKGWALSSDFYALGGLKMFIEKKENQWKITQLFAFD